MEKKIFYRLRLEREGRTITSGGSKNYAYIERLARNAHTMGYKATIVITNQTN